MLVLPEWCPVVVGVVWCPVVVGVVWCPVVVGVVWCPVVVGVVWCPVVVGVPPPPWLWVEVVLELPQGNPLKSRAGKEMIVNAGSGSHLVHSTLPSGRR